VLAEETLGEGFEVFARFGEGEGVGWFGPVEFVAGGLGGDPDLSNGSVGSDDEFAGAVLENDVHDTVVVFELEGTVVVLGRDEGLLEGFEGTVRFAAEGCFVDHVVSLAGLFGCMTDGSEIARNWIVKAWSGRLHSSDEDERNKPPRGGLSGRTSSSDAENGHDVIR
jgi:hypothetical protein